MGRDRKDKMGRDDEDMMLCIEQGHILMGKDQENMRMGKDQENMLMGKDQENMMMGKDQENMMMGSDRDRECMTEQDREERDQEDVIRAAIGNI